jgi:hypothetical protein
MPIWISSTMIALDSNACSAQTMTKICFEIPVSDHPNPGRMTLLPHNRALTDI